MIFFAFRGTPDELHATGIGHAGEFEYVRFRDLLVGMVHSTRHSARNHVDSIHKKLLSLPGPAHGKLEKRHAKHIKATEMPEGTSMGAFLALVYQETGYEPLNPNHH